MPPCARRVHLSFAAAPLRVRLSNAFGTAPLHITAAHIARARASGSDAIDPASDTVLRFSGATDVVIPAGGEYVSDPVSLAAADIAISLHFAAAPAQQTSHPGSRTTSYLLAGDHVAAASLPGAKTFDHWFNIAGIDVMGGDGAVSVIGDSITDGRGSTTNGNDRWTDDLARRLAASGRKIGVLNHGIGGGHVLLDGLGPNAVSRFDRDVLAQPGVRWLILFEAINDIGTFDPEGAKSKAAHDQLVRELTTAYDQMIAKGPCRRHQGLWRHHHALHGLRPLSSQAHQRGGPDRREQLDPRPFRRGAGFRPGRARSRPSRSSQSGL